MHMITEVNNFTTHPRQAQVRYIARRTRVDGSNFTNSHGSLLAIELRVIWGQRKQRLEQRVDAVWRATRESIPPSSYYNNLESLK